MTNIAHSEGALKPGRYFHPATNSLVCLRQRADEAFWDATWESQSQDDLYPTLPGCRHLFTDLTRKYLPAGGRLIEGGCGLAWLAWRLHLLGYHVDALDYAPRTVAFIKERVPEVNPVLGDVMALPFEEGSFDGYWSVGVIEHFYDGYQPVLAEAARVLKPGGFLFVTFPHMSRLRRFRGRKGAYPVWPEGAATDNFYQFMLDEYQVITDADQFELVERRPFDGVGGLRVELHGWKTREAKPAGPASLAQRLARQALGPLLNSAASPSVLLVLRRR
mgnify:CR=1 FL=1